MRAFLVALIAGVAAASAAVAAPGMDANVVNRLADAEFNHGQVMQIAAHLSDEIGGRMTNSPSMRKAEAWTSGKFREWGLQNVRLDPFEFGRGWEIERSTVRMTAPRTQVLKAIPVAWTPATKGALSAPVVIAPFSGRDPEKDFPQWRGKLRGRIVLVSYPRPAADLTEPPFKRWADADIAKFGDYRQPETDATSDVRTAERVANRRKLEGFLKAEGALAYVTMSRSDGGRLHGEGNAFRVNDPAPLPAVEMGAEDYRRLARLAKVGPVMLEIDSDVRFVDGDTKANNVLADIPGRDPKAGYVMAGAHLDSWVAGDGAADNGAGSAVVMEAARLLAAMPNKPKRTIRFALWAGEEEGLLGSFAYVDKYIAARPANTDPALAKAGPYYGAPTFPITPRPGFGDLAAYFNLDNGSGKIRGIFTEGNFAVAPIFREWFQPFASLGASAVVARTTGSTDHVFMSRLGLPAFQFIQDPLDYESIGPPHRRRHLRPPAGGRHAAGGGDHGRLPLRRRRPRRAAAEERLAEPAQRHRSLPLSRSRPAVTVRFAAWGLDHPHIFDHIRGLLAAGGEFAGYAPETTAPGVLKALRAMLPDVPELTSAEILNDETIAIVCNAAIPADRAAMGVEAMRHGKDVMCDKPGATTLDQLDRLRAAVAETGRIFSVCFSERLTVRAAQKAGELVQAGAIGRVIQTLGVGPHRLNRRHRPPYFFELERYGGIITDIASHQIDQFLFYTGSTAGEVVAATVGNYANAADPGLQDFGQLLLKSDRATGYIRVDWFTPDGLPTWGDGRLTILGAEGYIELRKYVDIDGKPGGDHLFLVDKAGVQHIDCKGETLTYFTAFLNDVRDRTETAMPQAHVFETSRLAIEAQAVAQVLTP